MYIHMKNTLAKFYLDPIRNDRGVFLTSHHKENNKNNKMTSDKRSVTDLKTAKKLAKNTTGGYMSD